MSGENISMTRISDLPPNNGQNYQDNFSNNASSKMFAETESNVYIPLNPHPNPYGNQPTGSMPPPPQQQYPYSQPQTQNQVIMMPQNNQNQMMMMPQNMLNEQPEYRLPQRDIPMDITDFTNDEQIQPNYIPRPKITSDYVEQHEQATKTKIREYEEQQKKENLVNQWLDKLYTPIILGFLYFMFQLPIINTLVFKRFSFLSIYKEDGNFNLLGLVLKSSLFASSFLFIENSMQYIIKMVE
jgi:hypothetical protein